MLARRIFDKVISKIEILRSLKFRIFLLIILIGMVPVGVVRHGTIANYKERAVAIRTGDIVNQCKILVNHLITYNYINLSAARLYRYKEPSEISRGIGWGDIQDTRVDIVDSELEQLTSLYDGRILVMDSNLKVIKDTYGIAESKTMITEEVIRCFKEEQISRYDEENQYIEVAMPIVDTEFSGVLGVILISVSTDAIVETARILYEKSFTLGMILNVLIVIIAAVASMILVRPLARVTQAIAQIKEGFMEDQIEVRDCLETELITDAFNELLERMKKLDHSRQEFVSNVSHELKTPLTSMKVLADSLIAQEEVPNELYKEFMVDIAEEIDRENQIISDLLNLVKLDKEAAVLTIDLVDINRLLTVILKRLRPIAAKKNIEMVFESIRQVSAEVDEVKISLAMSNLVENAIKYNVEDGWVKVTLDADHKFFTVTVADSGIGIPEEAKQYIFERFYRVDKSRSKEISGNGLGLAITRNAILMHRGAIKVSSVDHETVFTVKIPMNYIA